MILIEPDLVPEKEEKGIRSASTVVLCRDADGSDGPFEVFMTKRRRDLPFLGGFYVFPGGEMDEEDYLSESLDRCIGITRDDAHEVISHDDPNKSLGHYIAAIRELYEETGVLLAYNAAGKYPDLEDDSVREKFEKYREMINNSDMTMSEMMRKEDLYYDTGNLKYFYHKLAPKIAPVRFHARFFSVMIPDGQVPTPYEREIEACEWLTPKETLHKLRNREIIMAPPTITSLKILSKYEKIEDLLRGDK